MNPTTLVAMLMAALMSVLAACGTVPDRKPLPDPQEQMAEIPGVPNARFWGDATPDFLLERLANSTVEEIRARQTGIVGVPHYYLAISGGGPDGAFGAGLLNGWTETGTRPQFTMVTGISTGALIAPFAFLGSEYDQTLKDMYTLYTTDDLVTQRAWTEIITGDAAASTEKLREIIYGYMTPQLMNELADAFKQGRRLFVSTTNLDAKRPVIWNITAIAASDRPDKRDLISDVLLASASVPGAFPPVLFEVEFEGQRYDELHVDGGAVSQVFVYPTTIDWPALMEILDVQGRPEVYVIRNSPLDARWSTVNPDIFSIVGASVSSLIRTQGIGDLDRIYLTSLRDGNDFYLAYVPDDFDVEPQEAFDLEYMRALYDIGYEMALDGYPWARKPVGFDVVDIDLEEDLKHEE